MKKLSALVALALSLFLLASSAAAAEKVKGTVKEVDAKASKIKFAREGAGKEEVLEVDKGVDLKKVKANAKAEITVDGGVVKEIKAEAKSPVSGY